jgi:hypothetical protein
MYIKKIAFIILPTLMLAMSSFSGCKKQNLPLNVTLYDKDTVTIQKYIQGKWDVVYCKGGIANITQYFDGCTAEFTADKKYTISSPVGSETMKYFWRKELAYGYTDYVYVMQPKVIIFNAIKNDTLIYHEASVDAISYYLIKSSNN